MRQPWQRSVGDSVLTCNQLVAYCLRVTTVFEALADPVRRGLLDRLRDDGPQTLTALCSGTTMSRQGVTKHLDVLHHAGLVRVNRRGRERIHELETEPMRQLADWLEPYSAAWDDRLARLRQHLEDHP